MKKGNMALAGVAAVAIVICLIFAYVTLFDDKGDSGSGTTEYGTDTLRTEVVPGDYYVMDVAAADNTYKVIMLAVDVDGGNVLTQIGGEAPVWMTVDQFANVQPAGLTEVRTEVIDTAFGQRQCQVYEDPDAEGMYYWFSNGCLYRLQMDMLGTTVTSDIVENTLFSDAPALPEKLPQVTVGAGDWMNYVTYVLDASWNPLVVSSTRQDVVSVDGDEVTVTQSQDGSPSEIQVLPESVFLTGIDPYFETTVVGSGAIIFDGAIVGCDIVHAVYENYEITAYMCGGLSLLTIAVTEGYTGMTVVTLTNII